MDSTPTNVGNGMEDDIQATSSAPDNEFDIAIIGGGIIGVIVALGLLHRGMRVTVYERGSQFSEIGTGFAFPAIGRECMEALNPSVLEALRRVGEVNRHPQYRYWDGYNPTSKEAAASGDALLFQMSVQDLAYWGCLRSQFLNEMAKELPEGVTQFGKQLESYVDDESSNKVILRFTDGSSAEADGVIACDGIHSSARKMLLGQDNPASYPTYTNQIAYRAIVPIEKGIAALGDDKANNQCTHLGPNAHILSYPVAKWTFLNIFIFLHSPEPWTDTSNMTAPATRDEIVHALRDWSPAIQEVVSLLPEHLMKWGIFDMAEHPAPYYAHGRVCLAGDAAHASSPFHGVGASMGVEDALVLAVALNVAMNGVRDGSVVSKANAITTAFQTYSKVRLERSQWLVQSSREMGEISQWRYPSTRRDSEKSKAEFESRSRKIWDFDVKKMVAETESICAKGLDL